ncbi:hypothetical protein NL676_003545 [Syzygium grande]|nr:hypothetical protein NL676_003545 [Syzygium grande]
MAANPELDEAPNQIKFVVLLDGLKRLTRSERTLPKLLESVSRVMLGHLQEKVKQQCNGNEDEQISFVIADLTARWALEVAERMGTELRIVQPPSQQTLKLTPLEHALKASVCIAIPGALLELVHSLNGLVNRSCGSYALTSLTGQSLRVPIHPSVACFFTHFGWNYTPECQSNGIPLLCRPYFADQYLNRSLICDVWRVSLGEDGDENAAIT